MGISNYRPTRRQSWLSLSLRCRHCAATCLLHSGAGEFLPRTASPRAGGGGSWHCIVLMTSHVTVMAALCFNSDGERNVSQPEAAGDDAGGGASQRQGRDNDYGRLSGIHITRTTSTTKSHQTTAVCLYMYMYNVNVHLSRVVHLTKSN